MALIAMAVHCTEENDRLKYTEASTNSLLQSVDLKRNRVLIINNGSYREAEEYLSTLNKIPNILVLNLPYNTGTAAAINKAIAIRFNGEVVCKADDDVLWHQPNWVEELEQTIAEHPEIGILGLKRDDVYGDFIEDGKLLCSSDIIGTCTAFNPALLDKIGFMSSPSPQYGFDDVLMSVRSLAAGFKNAFLPHIKITHLDDGKNPYCDWKQKEAGKYIGEVSAMCDIIREGKMSYYYDGGFND